MQPATRPLQNHWFALLLLMPLLLGCALPAPGVQASPATLLPGSAPEIRPALQASRHSGTAPLAVFFDATDSRHQDQQLDGFRELIYAFDFGNPDAGTWTYSGLPKNQQVGGPLAAHVFEQPGIYEVQVWVQDPAGRLAGVSLEITVADPNQVFAGTATHCLSRNQDFTGCPAGARQLGNLRSWPAWRSHQRYLLKAGQDFTSLGRLDLKQQQHWQIGRFGNGAAPKVAMVNLEVGVPDIDAINWTEDAVIMDLDMAGFSSGNSTAHLLLLRNNSRGRVELGGTSGHFANHASDGRVRAALHRDRYQFLVENQILGSDGAGHTSSGRGIALLGNLINGNGPREANHSIRFWHQYKSITQHNRIFGAGPHQHNIKLHGDGDEPFADQIIRAHRPATAYVLISNNDFGIAGEGPQSVVVAPQNELVSEALVDVIVENNRFRIDSQEIHLGGRRLTSRGNYNDVGTTSESISSRKPGLTPGWDGPYFISEPAPEFDWLRVPNKREP